jgi:hypothetical protein
MRVSKGGRGKYGWRIIFAEVSGVKWTPWVSRGRRVHDLLHNEDKVARPLKNGSRHHTGVRAVAVDIVFRRWWRETLLHFQPFRIVLQNETPSIHQMNLSFTIHRLISDSQLGHYHTPPALSSMLKCCIIRFQVFSEARLIDSFLSIRVQSTRRWCKRHSEKSHVSMFYRSHRISSSNYYNPSVGETLSISPDEKNRSPSLTCLSSPPPHPSHTPSPHP